MVLKFHLLIIAEFGSLDWSPDESSIVYVAERKLKKSEPYIKRKGEDKPKADGSGEAPPKKVKTPTKFSKLCHLNRKYSSINQNLILI